MSAVSFVAIFIAVFAAVGAALFLIMLPEAEREREQRRALHRTTFGRATLAAPPSTLAGSTPNQSAVSDA